MRRPDVRLYVFALIVLVLCAGCEAPLYEADQRGLAIQANLPDRCCTAFRWESGKFTHVDCYRWEPCPKNELIVHGNVFNRGGR